MCNVSQSSIWSKPIERSCSRCRRRSSEGRLLMFRRFIVILMVSSLGLAHAGLAQTPSPQTGADTAMVLKGKAPVSRDVLKIKLPRPHEADLPNGVHLMVLEDHRLPQINVQIIIPGAGGYYDPAGR